MNNLVCHITRGTINPATVDAARDLHNAFLANGTPPGIDVAQTLGDVSHAAYLPVDAVTDATTPGELLFLDAWADAEAMERFFRTRWPSRPVSGCTAVGRNPSGGRYPVRSPSTSRRPQAPRSPSSRCCTPAPPPSRMLLPR
jgi:hypothetical protein